MNKIETSEERRATGHLSVRHTILGRTVFTVATLFVVLGTPTMAAASSPVSRAPHPGTVAVTAMIDNSPVAGSSGSYPVRLSPTVPSTLTLQITNRTPRAVTIRTIELEGHVGELTFFQYDTSVDLEVPARSATSLAFTLDLDGLRGQGTGLFPSSIRILGSNHQVLASESMVADVRGSLDSVYGLFGIVLVVLTGLALLSALSAFARHRLSPNRWLRATRMLTPGIGLGLVSVFTLSATRVTVPSNGHGLLSVGVFAVVFFLLGYLTPSPTEHGEDSDRQSRDPEDETVDDYGINGGHQEASRRGTGTAPGAVATP